MNDKADVGNVTESSRKKEVYPPFSPPRWFLAKNGIGTELAECTAEYKSDEKYPDIRNRMIAPMPPPIQSVGGSSAPSEPVDPEHMLAVFYFFVGLSIMSWFLFFVGITFRDGSFPSVLILALVIGMLFAPLVALAVRAQLPSTKAKRTAEMEAKAEAAAAREEARIKADRIVRRHFRKELQTMTANPSAHSFRRYWMRCGGCDYVWQVKKRYGLPAFCVRCRSDSVYVDEKLSYEALQNGDLDE